MRECGGWRCGWCLTFKTKYIVFVLSLNIAGPLKVVNYGTNYREICITVSCSVTTTCVILIEGDSLGRWGDKKWGEGGGYARGGGEGARGAPTTLKRNYTYIQYLSMHNEDRHLLEDDPKGFTL